MKILITGTRGFIGSVLTQRALDAGHQVIAVDNGDRGLNQVKKLQGGLTLVKWDCRQGISDLLIDPCDGIVHLAAGTGSLSRPYEELVDLNITMTQTLYGNACLLNVPVFVYPMTSLSLDSNLKDSPYVKSKQDGMDWLLAQKGVTRVIPFMFCNQAGAYKGLTEYRKKEVHVAPVMLDCYLKKVPFVINGDDYDTIDGTPARDYVNVINTADFILNEIRRNLTDTLPAYTSPIFLGTGQIITTLQLTEYFKEVIGPLLVEAGPRRAYDTGSIQCTSSALKDLCGDKMIYAKKTFTEEWTTLLELLLPSHP